MIYPHKISDGKNKFRQGPVWKWLILNLNEELIRLLVGSYSKPVQDSESGEDFDQGGKILAI